MFLILKSSGQTYALVLRGSYVGAAVEQLFTERSGTMNNHIRRGIKTFVVAFSAVVLAFIVYVIVKGKPDYLKGFRVPGAALKEAATIKTKPGRQAELSFIRGVNYVSWTTGEYPFRIAWKKQTYVDSQGIIKSDITGKTPMRGAGSLELEINTRLDDSSRKGEAFIDLRYAPNYEARKPYALKESKSGRPLGVDLSGKTLMANVYCGYGTSGSKSAPNGIQLFAKSLKIVDGREVWSSYYGKWYNIGSKDDNDSYIKEMKWCYITALLPDSKKRGHNFPQGSADKEFDPSSVAIIGIKYGLNEYAKWRASSRLWVDDFGWGNPKEKYEVVFPFEDIADPISAMKEFGFNAAAIVQTEYMASPGASVIRPHHKKSHTNEELVQTIKYMRENGIKMVMLKPHVDVADDSWRGEIQPRDTAEWFREYKDFILHYALIAEHSDVGMLVIGTELKSMTGKENRQEWEKIIRKIRNVYSGKLVYAANWDNYKNVCLWDMVDVVGIDAYFPLSAEKDPSVETLVKAWSETEFQGTKRSWKGELAEFQKKTGKPVVFTEIGYRSTDFAAREPSEYKERRQVNEALQVKCYLAMTEAFRNEPWFGGFLLWNMIPRKDYGGKYNIGFTPQHKIGERVFRPK